MAKNQTVIVKKVKAYPFAATVDLKGVKKPVGVIKLAPVGLWASLGASVVQVGMIYTVEFELPVLNLMVTCPAKVMRTMDRVSEVDKKVERLAEFQFIKPAQETLEKIHRFLKAINQAD